MLPNRPSSARIVPAASRKVSGRVFVSNPDRSIPLMDGMVMDTIESMQDMGDLYTKKIEVEKRRCVELENKLKVRHPPGRTYRRRSMHMVVHLCAMPSKCMSPWPVTAGHLSASVCATRPFAPRWKRRGGPCPSLMT